MNQYCAHNNIGQYYQNLYLLEIGINICHKIFILVQDLIHSGAHFDIYIRYVVHKVSTVPFIELYVPTTIF